MRSVYIIGGPNGAGKTTLAQTVLPEFLHVPESVNADLIAGGLSPFRPSSVAFSAGRAMLRRIHELEEAVESFGFETTLASRAFAGFLRELKGKEYSVILMYVWVASPRLALKRVRLRVVGGRS
jgi:predicted ABC-type ATPase